MIRTLAALVLALLLAASASTYDPVVYSDMDLPIAQAVADAVAAPAGELATYARSRRKRLHAFDGILLASRVSPDDLQLAAESGAHTVLNMCHPGEIPFDEGAMVESLGMRYVDLAWNGPDELTDDLVRRARTWFRDAERPLLVHCASSNRVGALWLAWRVVDQGIEVDAALVEAEAVGLRTPAYKQIILDYIDRHAEAPVTAVPAEP
jgi:protein tyrosine phosphatase (PTP) superfamily phosphohydrolase (DUF442 family)